MAEHPKIKIVSKDHQGQTFKLTDDEHTIGRKDYCDICIPDPSVSSKHCVLTRQEDGNYGIKDCDSTNGTRVNGDKVMQGNLQDSDLIRVGSVEIIYESPVRRQKKKAPAVNRKGNNKINLRETAGSLSIAEAPNFSPFPSNESTLDRSSGKYTRILGISIIAALTIVVLIALFYVIAGLR